MVRLMMIKMVKGIKLVTKVTISDVMIRFIATKVKDPPRSKIHQGQRSTKIQHQGQNLHRSS